MSEENKVFPDAEKKSPEKKSVATRNPEPVRFERHSRMYIHDLFKLTVANMKKNYSYRARQPKIIEHEHTHMWHSINDTTLLPNKYCSAVGGHCHEVSLVPGKSDEKGNPLVKIGPPLEQVSKKLPDGRQIKKWERVRYEAMNDNGETFFIEDNHTHGTEYFGSEEFSTLSRNQLRQENRQQVSQMSYGQPVSTQPARAAALHTGPDKDAVRGQISE